MCLFKQPKLPPLPDPQKTVDRLSDEARRRELARAAGGRAATLLTDPLGVPGSQTAGKTLLGG